MDSKDLLNFLYCILVLCGHGVASTSPSLFSSYIKCAREKKKENTSPIYRTRSYTTQGAPTGRSRDSHPLRRVPIT